MPDNFHHSRGATALVSDATFRAWRHIASRHISIISEAPPHFVPDATFWRHIVLTPHVHQIGGASTFAPDATFWRRIVWHRIFTEAPPHLCLAPHFDATFWRHIYIWTHIWRQATLFLAFEMAPRTGRRLEYMFPAAVIELAGVVSTVALLVTASVPFGILCIRAA